MKNKVVLTALFLTLMFTVNHFAVIGFTSADKRARLSSSVVNIDGKEIIFDTYGIENQQYFKLRDILYNLRGTEKEAEVKWEAENKTIQLVSGERYLLTGSEMAIKGKEDKKAEESRIIIKYDKSSYKFTAYLIGGNYYFLLKDIAEMLKLEIIEAADRYILGTKQQTELEETEDRGEEYIDRIIFMGDSTTNGLRAYAMLEGGKQTKQVWVPSNKTFSLFNQKNIMIEYPDTAEEMTIENAAALKKPEYLLITLGINGVSSMSEESFKQHYTELILRIQESSPDTKIILNSIYPVAKNYKNLESINNEKIDRANERILGIAKENNVKFLNSNAELKDAEGWLEPEYQNGDGLHLSPAAYTKILNYIRTHGY